MDNITFQSNANYSKKDRYHDFRRLFTSTDEGQRVFNEIISWGKLFSTSITPSPVDPLAMAAREGERNMALKLLTIVNNEPKEQTTKTRNKK